MKDTMQILNEKLKADPFFLDADKNIIREKVKASAINLDEHLIKLLLSDSDLKKIFFAEVNGVLVFDKVKFSWIISNSDFLPDSFTSYKNKIGLIDSDGNFIKSKDDVFLSFPYKDCVLEFDSSSDTERRNEVLLNEKLASNQIDLLLEPKCFTNSVLHMKSGNSKTTKYNGESLLIKGNNLIAMSSLLPRFSGAIQCMYWDTLYNTSSDQVPYNDSFKHSTWLTMMKNRLEVAFNLLKSSGIIFVQLDSNEMAYLKVMMDEIFGRQNYMATITCKVKAPSGVASGAQMVFDCSEYILAYARDITNVKFNHLKEDAEIVNESSKTAEFYKYTLDKVSFDNMELVKDLGDEKVYRIKKGDFSISILSDTSSKSYYDNFGRVFRTAALSGGREKEIAKIIKDQPDALDSLFVFEHVPDKGKRSGQVCRDLIYKNGGILMLSEFGKKDDETKQVIKTQHITSIFGNDWWQGISKEGGVTLKNGKKPEMLMKTIIEMASNKGDIVLDAFFGTGTTGAVATKLGRQFIGIEQLDSHYQNALTRLDEVLAGEQSGISKEVGWSGGGSYVSCELLKDNYKYIDQIKDAKDDKVLEGLFDRVLNDPFVLNFNVNIDNVKTNCKEDFEKLDFDSKKKAIISLLDKNMLYVNHEDELDKTKKVEQDDLAFSDSFYDVGK